MTGSSPSHAVGSEDTHRLLWRNAEDGAGTRTGLLSLGLACFSL